MNEKPQCAKDLERYAGKERKEVRNPCITAREGIAIANYIDQLECALSDAIGAMQVYQKSSGSDRADFDFSDEIKQIGEFLNE